MLKKYNQFIRESNSSIDIEDTCKFYGIKNYKINSDGSVDVYQDVDLVTYQITEFKIKFGIVEGNFNCTLNKLTSLEGAPSEVTGYFYCGGNDFTSLEGCPSKVGGNFACNSSHLTSLEWCPSEVGGGFDCSNNELTSLEGCPSEVGGGFDCDDNKLTSLKGGPSMVGGGFDCADNELTSFEGFPVLHREKIWVKMFSNPVYDIYSLFLTATDNGWISHPKAINIINEWEVIDVENMSVSYLRLSEVFKELNLEVPSRESIEFKHYTLTE